MTKQQFDAQQWRKGMKAKHIEYGEVEVRGVDFLAHKLLVMGKKVHDWLPCEQITLID